MPTNLYGPGDNYHRDNSHVLPALIRRFHEAADANLGRVTCWGTGTPLREFLHVDDLGDACVFALEHWRPLLDELSYINVGTGIDLSIFDLAKAVAKATGLREIEWDTASLMALRGNNSMSVVWQLGLAGENSLGEGLSSTVALFRNQLTQGNVRL